MAQAVRTAWNASRHWLATGFLASTILFLLLMFINWRNEHRGIASQKIPRRCGTRKASFRGPAPNGTCDQAWTPSAPRLAV